MHQNTKRLLSLVNQLLDFRKAEENKLALNLIYGNIVGFVEQIVNSFSDFKESKSITLEFLPDEKKLFMQFDRDKIEKILLNLLSNAFKFTKNGGAIKVFTQAEMTDNQEHLKIIVQDNGIGIKQGDQEKIFERFYQTDLPDQFLTRGSGIGLSLTKDFVELHNGKISVDSEPGKGSRFTIELPVNRKRLYDDELKVEAHEKAEHLIEQPQFKKTEGTKKSILLVDDHPDFMYYLKDSLQGDYALLEATNGKEALEILKDQQPHLIVSDVMMPEMDGYALCEEIKTNPSFSHIPIILLTAKSTQQDKLEGLKHGADEYFTKPFNFDILKSRIEYLLGLREKFIKSYQKSFRVEANAKSITPLDKKLLDKALDLVQKNIANSEYSVEKLSSDLNMSRVYLYKKIRSLTGKTPVELIRLMRLKKACELLIKGELTISEICYDVGFSDPRYFSKQFKAEFGVLPSKYIEQNQG
jgi:CheY-like chemotaxis protein